MGLSSNNARRDAMLATIRLKPKHPAETLFVKPDSAKDRQRECARLRLVREILPRLKRLGGQSFAPLECRWVSKIKVKRHLDV